MEATVLNVRMIWTRCN